MKKIKLLIATGNKNKLMEFKKIIPDSIFDIYTLNDFIDIDIPEEKGETFEEISINKALAVATQVRGQYWILAEDSGLCVPDLDGKPGIYSARFASDHDDDINQRALIKELHTIGKTTAKAYYKCSIALIPSQFGDTVYLNNAIVVDGKMEGKIIDTLKGDGGFGYDKMFVPDLRSTCNDKINKHDFTLAQMPKEVYHNFTHRTRATICAISALYHDLSM